MEEITLMIETEKKARDDIRERIELIVSNGSIRDFDELVQLVLEWANRTDAIKSLQRYLP